MRSGTMVHRSVAALTSALLAGLSLLGTGLAQDTGRRVDLIKPLTPELRAIAEAYYLNDPETVRWYRDIEKKPIPIDGLEGAFADIDDDGQPEAFFREGPSFESCGTIGCEVRVLKKVGNEWHLMGSFYDAIGEFTILPGKDHGVHRIWCYIEYDRKPGTTIWDGKEFH